MQRERVERGQSVVRLLAQVILIFGVTMVILTVLWPWIAPGCTHVVLVLSRPLFHLVESPNVTVLDIQGAEMWVYRVVGEGQITPVVWFDRYTWFALIPLIALLLATPGLGWVKRFALVAAGLGGLVVIHAVYLVASVELLYSAGTNPHTGAQVLVRLLWEAAPILIWVALTAGAWRRVLGSLRAAGRTNKELPRSATTVAAGS